MGRGLSELQQTVLLLALRGREARIEAQAIDGPPVADAYHDDILAEFWLWEPKPPPTRARRAAKGRRFSQDAIGYHRYNNTHVVLTRAVARLVDRDLVARVPRSGSNGAGVALTDAGVAAAYGLLERMARTRPSPARKGEGLEERGGLRDEGWRQFGELLGRQHAKVREDREFRRRLEEWIRQDRERRRQEHERWQQEQARQAQERVRQQEERLRDIYDNIWRALEEAERRLRGIGQPRTLVLPPEAISALELLGVSYPCSAEEVKAAFRRKSHEAHPDHGGTDREFIALRAAYEAVLKYAP